MEPEAVLNLFDSLWFHVQIFEKQLKTLHSSNPDHQIQENSTEPNVSRLPSSSSIHKRSKSDHLLYISSTNLAIKPHLQTIISDKEITLNIPIPLQLIKKPSKELEKKKKRFSKSLSELEFEEVKGFMDLGFVFCEDDKDSSLVEIIPGLQRLGQKTDFCDRRDDKGTSVEESLEQRVRRPYLSEAWETSKYRQKEEVQLMKWRVPSVSNEIDMKDNLKWWAHTVASAAR